MNIGMDTKKAIIGADLISEKISKRYDILTECEIDDTLLERYMYILRILDEEHIELFHRPHFCKHIYHVHIACPKESLYSCINQLDSLTGDAGLYGLDLRDIFAMFEKNEDSPIEFFSCNLKDKTRLQTLYECTKQKHSALLFFKGDYSLIEIDEYVTEFDEACDLDDILYQCAYTSTSSPAISISSNSSSSSLHSSSSVISSNARKSFHHI